MSPWLKYWFHIGSFFETMQPHRRVLKLFGLFPYTIVQTKGLPIPSRSHPSNNGCNRFKTLKSEVKFMDIVIFTLWQTFFLQMLYASWPKMFFDMPMSRIITMVTLILYLLAGFNCSVSATLVLLYRKKFIRLMQLVEETDCLFKNFFYEIQHSKHHLVCVSLLVGSFVCQGLLLLNDVTAGKNLVNTTLVSQNTLLQAVGSYYYIIRCIHISCVMAFIGGLYSFRDRFLAFNMQLRICLLKRQPAVEQMVSFRQIMNQIQAFTAIYSNLCDSIGIFCTIFVWQPMMFCASLIVTAVFSILTIGHILTDPAPIVLALAMIYSALTILYTLIFLLLVKLGSDLKREGKQTAILVHKAINQSSKTPALVDRRPVVSCGLFCFDWTLALSIISALATYSVILIQFELGVPKFFISAILQQNVDISATNT
uniref:Gustatory receptor n=1 Tax=Anopheles christyi TaxID=43041 RepID=A0A182JQN5_9DIPT